MGSAGEEATSLLVLNNRCTFFQFIYILVWNVCIRHKIKLSNRIKTSLLKILQTLYILLYLLIQLLSFYIWKSWLYYLISPLLFLFTLHHIYYEIIDIWNVIIYIIIIINTKINHCFRSDAKRDAHRKRTTSSSNRPLSSIDGLDLFDSLGVERGHEGQVF